jgi:regulator of sirC expression with transglutaminase-like and TPR domain
MKLLLAGAFFCCLAFILKPTCASAMETAQVEALYGMENLLGVKLAVDKAVQPSSDVDKTAATIARMAAEVWSLAGDTPRDMEKLAALKQYLYESGPWNDERPFQYDQEDPLGEKPENRVLERYLTTRRGNCITMPILFLAIGQRLGLRMALAEAPLHVFVKYTDEASKVWNIEATSSGGFTREVWYREKLPMSDQAVANGVYLRPLSNEEGISLVASFLVEDRLLQDDFEGAIAISDVLLRHYPNFAYGWVKRGSAYAGLLRREVAGKYVRVEDIPPDLRSKADHWYRENQAAFSRAEALGWLPQ